MIDQAYPSLTPYTQAGIPLQLPILLELRIHIGIQIHFIIIVQETILGQPSCGMVLHMMCIVDMIHTQPSKSVTILICRLREALDPGIGIPVIIAVILAVDGEPILVPLEDTLQA